MLKKATLNTNHDKYITTQEFYHHKINIRKLYCKISTSEFTKHK